MRHFHSSILGMAMIAMASLILISAQISAAPFEVADTDSIVADSDTVMVKPVATASDAFLRMPSKVLELLNRDSRLDLVEYIKADKIQNRDSMPEVNNTLGGISRLAYPVTDDYLAIQVTPVSLLQFRLLYPKGKREKPVVAVAYTLSNSPESADTEVAFYDDMMNLLNPDKFLKLARLEDLIDIPDHKKHLKDELIESVPFPMIEYTLSPDSETLKARLSIGDILGVEQQERIRPYLRPFIVYKWDGHKFKLEK